MRYTFENEELLFLCGLVSANKAIGLQDTLTNSTEEGIKSKYEKYEQSFLKKNYLFYDPKEKLKMVKEIGKVIRHLVEAEYTLSCYKENETPTMQYIYYQKENAIYMTNVEGICEIEYFDEYMIFENKLIEVFDINDLEAGIENFYISMGVDKIDKAISLIVEGKKEEAQVELKSYGVEEVLLQEILQVMIEEKNAIYIQGLHRKMLSDKEVEMKIVTVNSRTWLVKFNTQEGMINIYRLEKSQLLKAIFNF